MQYSISLQIISIIYMLCYSLFIQRESVHFDDLEDMVRELGQELSERSQQRQHLAQALDHSCEQLKNLQARSAQASKSIINNTCNYLKLLRNLIS